MSSLLRRCFVGLVLLLIPCSWLTAADNEFPGEKRKWLCFQSPHFELYSGNGEAESRELLFKLEVLRAIFLDQRKLKEKRVLPITIYYFGYDDDFRAYTPTIYQKNDQFAGYYIGRADRASIAMAPRDDEGGAQRIIFHEYIHHLMTTTEQKPPTWYNEGMADLFATIKIEWGKVELGHPNPGRVYELKTNRLLPVEQLLAANHQSSVFTESKHTGIYYAQSWALVHYCYLGESKIPKEKRLLFLRAASSSKYADPELMKQLCRELLGMDYVQLSRELTEYIHYGRYAYAKFDQPEVVSEKSYSKRTVPREEMRARLAELEARINHTAKATLALLQAAEANPADSRPYEVLGTVARHENDENLTVERWQRALERGSTNPAIYHELGLVESRRWFSQSLKPSFRLPDEVAAHLREMLLHSIQYAPNQSAAYEMLAWVEATANEPVVANFNLVQQHISDMTDRRRTMLATALFLWRKDAPDKALAVLDALDKMERDTRVQWDAETLRATIEKRRPIRPESSKGTKPAIRVKVQKPTSGQKPIKPIIKPEE